MLCFIKDNIFDCFSSSGSENNSLYIYYKGLSKQLLTFKFDTVRSVLVSLSICGFWLGMGARTGDDCDVGWHLVWVGVWIMLAKVKVVEL